MKELNIQATEVFQKNYQATKRFIVNIGGSRSTKTYSILQLLIVKALSTEEPLLISIVRKSFPSLRLSVMRDFFDILKKLDLYDENNYNATVGFEFFSFNIKIKDKVLKLQIWDTCGQEIYRSLITNFYRNSSLAIMVYAIDK